MTKSHFKILRKWYPEQTKDTFLAMQKGEDARYHVGPSLTGCGMLGDVMRLLSDEGYVVLYQRNSEPAQDRHHVRQTAYFARRTAKPTRRDVVDQIFNTYGVIR
tara:strand:- start:1019 stop:1330 length:312 start_codon:yes stop_codon:yes gene_type:complete